METKGFSHFEIIINVLVSSYRFIWIPVLCVYGNYKYFYSYSAGIDFAHNFKWVKITQTCLILDQIFASLDV